MSEANGKNTSRQLAFSSAIHAQSVELDRPLGPNGHALPTSSYFGCNIFGLAQMREKLTKEAYTSLLKTLDHGKKLPRDVSDMIASAIKDWAVSRGVTHYCHWFHPLNGLTAEKHDAFIGVQFSHHSELRVMETFTGSQLIQGEPDASSFPNGGTRSTFEARGYTAWDPSSPLFIIEENSGKTLCIPTVFFGYHGQALDVKTPLLRSIEALSQRACDFLKLLGDVDVKRVNVTLGAEQEYFLIDKSFVALRPDLLLTGRTLLGAAPVRGQQLEDHYFGSIPTRVKAYMAAVEVELYKLGIPVKTRHNEVAPSQFELAPIYEDVNIAADHNALTMDVLRRTALAHSFVCLLHEKPFAGVNGSGKHNNWALSNDKGENLIDPGTTPHQNLRFLAILCVILKAVYDHADVLRASIASPGNDHRLGANEAPPAIISVFLGNQLHQILESIEGGQAAQGTDSQIIHLGINRIPDISKDYTDRNRTSPFAFTGNKFEFRAVGSSTHCAVPMSILNAAVAESFELCTKRLKELLQSRSRDEAVMTLIKELAKETKAIRFEGNGYSLAWREEAKKRGLPIFNTSGEALEVLNDHQATQFLSGVGVLSPAEIKSRYHIAIERYIKTIELEFHCLSEMVRTMIVPTIEKQLIHFGRLSKNIESDSLRSFTNQSRLKVESTLQTLLVSFTPFEDALYKLEHEVMETDKVQFILKTAWPQMLKVRAACDQLENLVADEIWPLPKYREMLFANTLS